MLKNLQMKTDAQMKTKKLNFFNFPHQVLCLSLSLSVSFCLFLSLCLSRSLSSLELDETETIQLQEIKFIKEQKKNGGSAEITD